MSVARFGGGAASWVGATLLATAKGAAVAGGTGAVAPVVLPVLAGGAVVVGLVVAAKHFSDKSKKK